MLEELLKAGYLVKQKELKNQMICEFKNGVKDAFEDCNDVESLKERIFDFIKNMEMTNLARYF